MCEPLLAVADHLFTTRQWALGRPTPGPGDPWGEVARALGVGPDALVRVRQVHGAAVAVARGPMVALRDADIIVSDRSGLAIAVQAADCVPLLIADGRTGAVAAAHAGWRGLAANVPGEAIAALAREFGTRPADVAAAIGPSIGPCCYEVGADVRNAFTGAFPAGESTDWFGSGARAGAWLFDTWAAARGQLEASGVPGDQIYEARLCTAGDPEMFCSYRRDGPPAGRIAGAIRSRRAAPRRP